MLNLDQENSLFAAMVAVGLEPKDRAKLFSKIKNGRPERYQVVGDKSGSLNGVCTLYENDGKPAGWFWSWKDQQQHVWTSFDQETLTGAEKQAWKDKQQELAKQRQAEQEKNWVENQQKVADLIKKSGIANDQHAYLVKKGVHCYGLRRLNASLVVPIRNASGEVMSAQFISPAGEKRFKSGARIEGGYYAIGKPDGVLLLCEGYATGASLYEATGYAVAVAFNAGNLLEVAKVLRKKLADTTIIVCADNDVSTEGNPGLIKAQVCAEQVGGMLVYPKFQDQMIDGKVPTDFNDLHRLSGLEAVRTVINAVLQPAAAISPAPSREQSNEVAVKNKQYFENLIEAHDDFDYLTDHLLREIASAKGIKVPLVEFLLSQIAKKCETTKGALMDEYKSICAEGGNASLHQSDDEVIARLNQEHAVLQIGGKTVIMNRAEDKVVKKRFFTFSSKSDFELNYCNRYVYQQGEKLSWGQYWLEHPDRAQYKGMVFLPDGDEPGYLNFWQGWGMEPASHLDFRQAQDMCFPYLDFVADVICNNDQALCEYLLNWCAHLVQRPQELPETALVFRGREGIGKNSFVDPLQAIVGREHALMLTQMSQISGRFSGHLANALLVFCNETVWGGDKSAQGVLKSMITESVQPVEFKGKDLTQVASFKRCIFATNETWAVPRGADDRRYVIVDVSDKRKGDQAFFTELKWCMNNGGTAALFRYLQLRDIGDWHPRSIPEHILKKGWEMKVMSANSVARWWLDMLQHGYLYEDKEAYADESKFIWPVKCAVKVVEHSYLKYCEMYKVSHPEHMSIVGKALHDWGLTTCRPSNGSGPRPLHYKVPALDDARAIFSQRWAIPETYWQAHEDGNAFA